jgi:hypothetical protein
VLKWKKGDRRGLMESFQSYRQVQLLERHFNNVNKGALMPMVMADVVLLGVIALYSAIALHAKLSLPMLVVVVVLAFDAVILTQIGVYRHTLIHTKVWLFLNSYVCIGRPQP